MEKINLIAVTGPTAGGKTAFAAQLAHLFGRKLQQVIPFI
jgi:tRNA A37 N6-isopentenylltransferase MiaA